MKAFDSSLLFLFIFFRHITSSFAICYYPSGDVAPQDLPCNDDTDESSCCGPAYACLSNGICMSTGLERQLQNQAQYVRGSCTDKNWRSSTCPSFCVNPANNDKLDGGIGMKKCPNRHDDTYYCDDGADFDCDTLENVLSFQGTPTILTTIGVAETSSSSLSSSEITTSSSTQSSETFEDTQSPETESAAPAESSNEQRSGSQSKGLTIGLAVGIPIGVLGLAAAGFMFFWSRRKIQVGGKETAMQQAPPIDGSYANGMNGYCNTKPDLVAPWMPPVEVYAEGVPPVYELPTGHR